MWYHRVSEKWLAHAEQIDTDPSFSRIFLVDWSSAFSKKNLQVFLVATNSSPIRWQLFGGKMHLFFFEMMKEQQPPFRYASLRVSCMSWCHPETSNPHNVVWNYLEQNRLPNPSALVWVGISSVASPRQTHPLISHTHASHSDFFLWARDTHKTHHRFLISKERCPRERKPHAILKEMELSSKTPTWPTSEFLSL